MDKGKDCDNFVPHPIRKQCKECLKTKEEHSLREADVGEIRNIIKEHIDEAREPDTTELYAWVPPSCPVSRLDEFFKNFPEDQVPKRGSEGEKKLLRQLVHQVPLSDVSAKACRAVEQEATEELEAFVGDLLDTKMRIGRVKEWEAGMSVQCPECLLIFEPENLVVSSLESGGPCYHPHCFQCFQCKQFLADLVHCADVDGAIFCVRHFCEGLKKRCHACDELIFSAQFALAGDKYYHRNHLVCFGCQEALQDNKGFEKDEELYCSTCYEEKFAKDCSKCKKRISVNDRHVSYGKDSWHFECFTCQKCEDALADRPFEIVEGHYYCSDCYSRNFAPRCQECSEVFDLNAKVVKYEGKIYHVPCFKCADCGEGIGTQSFVPQGGLAYCRGCHLRSFGVRCFGCKGVIADERGVRYDRQPYHEGCFTCRGCSARIGSRPFKAVDGDWFCMECYAGAFGTRCQQCEQPILLGADQDILYSYQKYQWHATCFICSECKGSLAEKRFIIKDKVLTCDVCMEQGRQSQELIEATKERQPENSK